MANRETNKKRENFFEDVYAVVQLIPRGRVTSYGAIAAYLGMKSGARMVGWAMNASHGVRGVPAHRVVNSQGLLTGRHHFETPETMEKRLLAERVVIRKHQVIDFKNRFWDPLKELG